MPRKALIRSKNLPYHVTSRSQNKEWFTLPLDQIWQLSQDSLCEAINIYPVEVISFVLMGNHYHMLLITPDGNLDLFMYEFNKRLALKIQAKSGQANRVFGNRYKWCLIQSHQYFINCYKYIYQNPLRAKIVERCEEYPYSTLFYIVSNIKFSITLYDKYGFKDDYGLNWLNKKIEDDEIIILKKRLNRSTIVEIKVKSKTKDSNSE